MPGEAPARSMSQAGARAERVPANEIERANGTPGATCGEALVASANCNEAGEGRREGDWRQFKGKSAKLRLESDKPGDGLLPGPGESSPLRPDMDPDRNDDVPCRWMSRRVGARSAGLGKYIAGGMRRCNRTRHKAKCLLMRSPLSLQSQPATEPRALVSVDESPWARSLSKKVLASTRARQFFAARHRR